MNLSEKYEFRSIRREEAEQVAELEQICFPPAEAISREDIIDRVSCGRRQGKRKTGRISYGSCNR